MIDMAIQHYSGKIGEFDYDDEMFTVKHGGGSDYLHYNDRYKGQVRLPDGLTSCYGMFLDCNLPYRFSFGNDFDTSKITNMSHMFCNCNFPKGISLGDNFDTSKVTNMKRMFAMIDSKFANGMPYLGDKFDTGNVTSMSSMFYGRTFPKDFSLGDKFDTGNVVNMDSMFYRVRFSSDFTFGDKFDTGNVIYMDRMFARCQSMPELDFDVKIPVDVIDEEQHLALVRSSGAELGYFIITYDDFVGRDLSGYLRVTPSVRDNKVMCKSDTGNLVAVSPFSLLEHATKEYNYERTQQSRIRRLQEELDEKENRIKEACEKREKFILSKGFGKENSAVIRSDVSDLKAKLPSRYHESVREDGTEDIAKEDQLETSQVFRR